MADAYARARALGDSIADPMRLIPVLLGLWASAISREGPTAAQPLADQMLAVAERTASEPALLWAHIAQGNTRYNAGDLARAREHFVRALALAQQSTAPALPADARVVAHGLAAHVAVLLGLADEARQHARLSVELAERGQRLADRAFAESFAALVHFILLDPAAAREHAERTLAVCAEEPSLSHEAVAMMVRAWALAEEGAPRR